MTRKISHWLTLVSCLIIDLRTMKDSHWLTYVIFLFLAEGIKGVNPAKNLLELIIIPQHFKNLKRFVYFSSNLRISVEII
jgi:hypothetical protein